MSYRPMTFARYGVYAALALAVGSVLLATNAGQALDIAVLQSLFVFVGFTALAFGAEAVISAPGLRRPALPAHDVSAPGPSVLEEEAE